nr:hypothetical protein [Tanacetum cinerariifolium]
KATVPSTRRKRGVVIRDPKEESSTKTPTETTSKDKGKGILVEEPKPIKKKRQVELDEPYARKLQEEFNQDIDWETAIDNVKQRAKEEPFIQIYQNTAGFTLDYFKGMSYDDIRPIFAAKFNANMEFLLKSKEQIKEEESRAIATINVTPAQKAAKRRKLIEEAKEAESIKQHLQIVPDEDDDVFTKAISLARKTGRNLGDNRVTTMGFDMSKVKCYNCHRKGHFARECRYPKDKRRTGGAEPHRRTTPEEPANFTLMAIPSSSSSDNEASLESVESRLVVYKQNESIFQENIIVLKNEVEASDNFILTLKQNLKRAETEKDDLKLKFENFQSSSKSLTELIASQTNNKHGLGYLSLEDDSESVSLTCPSDRLSPSGGYHVVPPPITENFMPPKPNLIFNTAHLAVESDHSTFSVQVSPVKPAQAMSHTTESMAPIIEDWVSDLEDESEPNDQHNVYV